MDTVFVVDDELMITAVLKRLLSDAGYRVEVFSEAEPALAVLEKRDPFLVVLDLQLPGISGMEALQLIKQKRPATEVVMISGYGTIDAAVEAMKLGASDFLSKPLQLPEVLSRVSRIHETHRLRNEINRLHKRRRSEFMESYIGSTHPRMHKVHRTLQQVAKFANVVALITGESGTGKEQLARRLHYQSRFSDGPFTAINCAALPESLIESELFGYEPGSFTGALAEGKIGQLAAAAGGTLFLDEFGDLSAAVQVKLLRFLQERRVTPLGGTESNKIECNILAATNRDPERMVQEGLLRDDLYYRINVIRFHLPPLRERPDDILPYAEAILKQMNRSMGCHFEAFDRHAQHKLLAHHWPGNVRELKNVIERACLLGKGKFITAADLLTKPQETAASLGERLAKPMALETANSIYVREILESFGGNKAKAARILEISRNRLKRLLTQA